MSRAIRRTFVRMFVVAGLLGVFAACGDDDGTGPEGPGNVSAVAVDDGDEAAGTAGAARTAGASARQQVFTGTFEGDLQVEISTDGETWTELGSAQSVSVDLQVGEEATIHGGTEVSAGNYRNIRLVMSGASATLEAGGDVGGTPIDSQTTVSVAGGSEVTIEAEVFPFTVDAENDMTIVVDLEAEDWITAGTIDSENASATAVETAVSLEAVRD